MLIPQSCHFEVHHSICRDISGSARGLIAAVSVLLTGCLRIYRSVCLRFARSRFSSVPSHDLQNLARYCVWLIGSERASTPLEKPASELSLRFSSVAKFTPENFHRRCSGKYRQGLYFTDIFPSLSPTRSEERIRLLSKGTDQCRLKQGVPYRP
jgi:hypothetical protein